MLRETEWFARRVASPGTVWARRPWYITEFDHSEFVVLSLYRSSSLIREREVFVHAAPGLIDRLLRRTYRQRVDRAIAGLVRTAERLQSIRESLCSGGAMGRKEQPSVAAPQAKIGQWRGTP